MIAFNLFGPTTMTALNNLELLERSGVVVMVGGLSTSNFASRLSLSEIHR